MTPDRAFSFPAPSLALPADSSPPHPELVLLLAHEMRAPLCAIVSLTDLLLDPSMPLTAEQRESLECIAHAGERLARLLEDGVEMCRSPAVPLQVHRVPLDLEPVLRQALLESAMDGVRVELQVASPLPRVYADADRIVQVVVNLLANARRYSPPEGTVSIFAEPRGREVQVSVHDDGLGIEPSARDHLYAAFEPGSDPIARVHGGFGLGLYVCRTIVEQHGGRIEAEGVPGLGTTFRFTLPCSHETEPRVQGSEG